MGKNTQQRIEDRSPRLGPGTKARDSVAAYNIAVDYRIRGHRRLAFQWWRRAAALGDDDAWLEVGYCYHHGIGTRQDVEAAAVAYDLAIRSETISVYSMEEALYHRAVLLLERDDTEWTCARASRLLRRASEDSDFQQASILLSSIKSGRPAELCYCRRRLIRSLGAAHCSLHRPLLRR